jgi:hypothetical protein
VELLLELDQASLGSMIDLGQGKLKLLQGYRFCQGKGDCQGKVCQGKVLVVIRRETLELTLLGSWLELSLESDQALLGSMIDRGQGKLKLLQGYNVPQGKGDRQGKVCQGKVLVVIRREMLEQ